MVPYEKDQCILDVSRFSQDVHQHPDRGIDTMDTIIIPCDLHELLFMIDPLPRPRPHIIRSKYLFRNALNAIRKILRTSTPIWTAITSHVGIEHVQAIRM